MTQFRLILTVLLSLSLSILARAQVLSEIQGKYLGFVQGLYFFAREAKRLQQPNQQIRDIYWSYTPEKQRQFEDFLDKNKDVLLAMGKISGLNKVNDIEIVPQSIHDYIVDAFARFDKDTEVEAISLCILKLIGGTRDFGGGKILDFRGVIEVVEKFDFQQWMPISNFISNFHSTIARAREIDPSVGKTMVPIVENYFVYMDTISRLRVLQGVIEAIPDLKMTGEMDNDLDLIAVSVFQNTGPILIKLFQQLQEEISGETSIHRVLRALDKAKPMDQKKAEKVVKDELKGGLGVERLTGFALGKPFGIASIAQTHPFVLEKKTYVVKFHKNKVRDIFQRERQMLLDLVSTYRDSNGGKVFDKGMKSRIYNIAASIEIELNFSFERKKILEGEKAYTDVSKKIETITLPKHLFVKKKESNGLLMMTLAPGMTLAAAMEESSAENIGYLYEDILKLYEHYLEVALDINRPNLQFYHGDLHRKNIYYDPATRKITLIDFGNASPLDKKLGFDITQVLILAQKTNPKVGNRNEIKDAMQKLSDKLKEISVGTSNYNGYAKNLVDVYFRTCFNPTPSDEERLNYSFKVTKAVQVLDRRMQALNLDLEVPKRLDTAKRMAAMAEVKELEDNIDFSNAVLSNCLNNITYPLNAALLKNTPASKKLKEIFSDLQKNGISIPGDIIFFNKSKGLLEGILSNLADRAREFKADVVLKKPEAVFKEVLSRIDERFKALGNDISIGGNE